MKSIKKKIKKALPSKVGVKVKHSPVEVSVEWERPRRKDPPGHVLRAERRA